MDENTICKMKADCYNVIREITVLETKTQQLKELAHQMSIKIVEAENQLKSESHAVQRQAPMMFAEDVVLTHRAADGTVKSRTQLEPQADGSCKEVELPTEENQDGKHN